MSDKDKKAEKKIDHAALEALKKVKEKALQTNQIVTKDESSN